MQSSRSHKEKVMFNKKGVSWGGSYVTVYDKTFTNQYSITATWDIHFYVDDMVQKFEALNHISLALTSLPMIADSCDHLSALMTWSEKILDCKSNGPFALGLGCRLRTPSLLVGDSGLLFLHLVRWYHIVTVPDLLGSNRTFNRIYNHKNLSDIKNIIYDQQFIKY